MPTESIEAKLVLYGQVLFCRAGKTLTRSLQLPHCRGWGSPMFPAPRNHYTLTRQPSKGDVIGVEVGGSIPRT